MVIRDVPESCNAAAVALAAENTACRCGYEREREREAERQREREAERERQREREQMKRCAIWGGARKGGLEGACYQCVMVLSAHLQLSLVQAEEVAAVCVQG